MEHQLTEFYWLLFFQLQKNNIVWERMVIVKDPNDALTAEVDYKTQRDFFYPNNEKIVKIIESKFHLARPEKVTWSRK